MLRQGMSRSYTSHMAYTRTRKKTKHLASEKADIADLRYLEYRLGNRNTIANFLVVDRSRVGRWIEGEPPTAENEEKIIALRLITTRLARLFSGDMLQTWLEGINAHLANQRPIDLIRNGRITEVLQAIEQEEAGSYA
jgi:hypothetical protein